MKRLLPLAITAQALAPLRMPIAAPDRPLTYSNPLGATLTQIKENVSGELFEMFGNM